MKFLLADDYEVWWPATIRAPDPKKPGTFTGYQCELLLIVPDREAAVANQEAYRALQTDQERVAHDVARLMDVVRDWRGIHGPDGAPAAMTPDRLRRALGRPWFRDAIAVALSEVVSGIEVATEGN